MGGVSSRRAGTSGQPARSRRRHPSRCRQEHARRAARHLAAAGEDVRRALARLEDPQLVQLGLYGLARSDRYTPLQKMNRLVSRHLPAFMPFKVEAFRVLAASYPQLDDRQRGRCLGRIERIYRREIGQRSDEPDRHRTATYEWYNLLVWLQRAAPADPAVEAALAAVRSTYPDLAGRSGAGYHAWVHRMARLGEPLGGHRDRAPIARSVAGATCVGPRNSERKRVGHELRAGLPRRVRSGRGGELLVGGDSRSGADRVRRPRACGMARASRRLADAHLLGRGVGGGSFAARSA